MLNLLLTLTALATTVLQTTAFDNSRYDNVRLCILLNAMADTQYLDSWRCMCNVTRSTEHLKMT